MSFPKFFKIIADTLCIASFAIVPSLPVAIICFLFPPGASSLSIGKTIPESPITARPFTLPTS